MSFKIVAPNDPALEALQIAIDKNLTEDIQLKLIPWADYHSTLMDTLSQEVSIYQAVFIPGHIWLPSLAHSGQIVELSNLFKYIDTNIVKEYNIEDIIESVYQESRYNEGLYQLPLFSDGHILYYKDDLDISKMDVPIVSVKEVFDIAKFSNNPPRNYGISLKADVSEIFTDFLPYLWEFGGEIFDSNGKVVINSEKNIKALEFYCSLREFTPPESDTYGNEEILESLKNGESTLTATWGGQSAPLFQDGGIGYKAATFQKPWNATWGVAIPSNQPEDIQLETLEILLKLLNCSTDNLVTKIAGSPVRKSSYTKEEFEKYPWLKAQYEMLKRAKPLPSIPKLGDFLGALYEYTHKAFTRKMTPKEALDKVQKIALDF